MKRILLLFSVFAFQFSFAQDMWGVSNSNFAGSTGMNLNPASMMLTPYCWEVTFVTLNVNVENNYMGIIKGKKAMLMSDANHDVVEDHIVHTFFFAGSPCSSETTVHTCQRLYFQSDMFNYMAHPGALFNPAEKASCYTFTTTMLI